MSWSKETSTREALACISAANLCFLDVWSTWITPARQYHLLILPRPLDFGLTLLNVVGVAFLMFVLLVFARRWVGERAAGAVSLAYLLLILIFIAKAYDLDISWPNRLRALMSASAAAGLFAIWKSPAAMPKIFRSIGLFLLPCLAVTTAHSAESLLLRHVESGSALSRPAHVLHHAPKAARTALIVFDMLDFDLLFNHKSLDVDVPEFERLRTETLFARNAMSPAGFTEEALPAMTIGKVVTDSTPVSSDDLLLTIAGSSRKTPWSLQPTIFSEARNSGMAVGLVGWYHPYCRLFRAMLSTCEWVPIPDKLKDRGLTAWNTERALISAIVQNLVGPGPNLIETVLRDEENGRRKYIDAYQRLLSAATAALTNPALDLVVVHLSVPHTPPIYDRATRQFTTDHGDYLDNLALADRTLGVLRQEMERAEVWETTNVIVTADHGFRSTGPPSWNHIATPLHVPFFLKMGGSGEEIQDDHRFNTIVVHDLLLGLLNRTITTPVEAEDFLDQR